MGKIKTRLPKEEIIIFSNQLALVIDSDVSLYEGIEIIKDKTDHKGLKSILEEVLEDLNNGNPIGHALKKHEGAFSSFFIHMVDIGEKSGDLTNTLKQVSASYEKELETRDKVKSAVTYPLILAILMVGVIMLLVLKVLPMFNEILASLGGEMPALTSGIMGISTWIGKYIWLLIGIIVAIYLVSLFFGKTEKGGLFFDKLKFKVPVLKGIMSSIIAVRFARNLAVLIKSGISMSVGISMIKPIMGNTYVEEQMIQAVKALEEGAPADEVIENLHLFPWVLVKLFSVAETTGHMDEMLLKSADVMEKETESQLEGLTTVIEPILIMVLSGIVGLILISVILPIINILNTIG